MDFAESSPEMCLNNTCQHEISIQQKQQEPFTLLQTLQKFMMLRFLKKTAFDNIIDHPSLCDPLVDNVYTSSFDEACAERTDNQLEDLAVL